MVSMGCLTIHERNATACVMQRKWRCPTARGYAGNDRPDLDRLDLIPDIDAAGKKPDRGSERDFQNFSRRPQHIGWQCLLIPYRRGPANKTGPTVKSADGLDNIGRSGR